MGTTTRGFPYPEPADPISQGADAIKALAEKVDTSVARIASGVVTLTTAANSASGTVFVTFPVGLFPVAPRVAVVTRSGNWWAFTGASSTSGVSIGCASYVTRAATAVPLEWVAAA